MRQRSETWASLAARGRFGMEVVAVIGGVSYSAISAPVIDRALFTDTLSVGHCTAASMMVSILTDDVIPAAASVEIRARLFDDTRVSEWRTFGTFYIAQREEDNGLVSLQCFDAMLKATQTYVDPTQTDDRIGWPKSMTACVTECAARIGVELDSRTVINTGDAYQVAYPTNYTMHQVLEYIAACHGGNWVITPENKLRLVPLVASPTETFDIIDYEYNKIHTDDGYKLVWQHRETGEAVINQAGGDLLNVPVVIGKITTAKTMTISRVTIARDEQLGYTKGDDTGVELRIENNPYASQAVCDDLYTALNGLEYRPFTITQACYDPCTELGDWILVGDTVRSVIYSQTVTLGVDFRANTTAPGKDETSSEYPYLTEIQRLQKEDERLKRYMEESKDEIDSKIEQTRTSILLEVGGTYATKDSVTSSITILENSITAVVERVGGLETNAVTSASLNVSTSGISLSYTKSSGGTTTGSSFTVSNQIGLESDTINLGANRLIIDSNNFKLTGTGEVKAGGKFTTSAQYTKYDDPNTKYTYTASLDGGGLDFERDGSYMGSLSANVSMSANSGSNYDYGALDFLTNTDAISFSVYNGDSSEDTSTYYFALNNGMNPGGYTERFYMDGDVRVLGTVRPWYVELISSSGSTKLRSGHTSSGLTGLAVDGYVYASGNMWCGGTKNRAVETKDYGTVGLTAMESTYAVFSDLGSGALDSTGRAYVFFDPDFAETVELRHEYQVFITPTSKGGIQRVEKHGEYFMVHGDPGTTFDWMVYARQRDYENHRLERVDVAIEQMETTADPTFFGDNIAPTRSIQEAKKFTDDIDDLAQAYLQNYEAEVYRYDN